MRPTPAEIDYLIATLRDRLTVANSVQIDMRISVTHAPNFKTGHVESRPDRGTTIVITIDGGARETVL